MIRWIERSPDLHEARATLPDGTDAYVGYVAVSPGDTTWRGYIGHTFTHVGRGPRAAMRRAVERRAAEALGALGALEVGREGHGANHRTG